MAIYAINYDLTKPGQNYPQLSDAIKKYGTHWHCMGSFWTISTSETATQVHANLRRHIDASDKLMVSQMGRDAAWSGLPDAGTPWLQERLRAA